MAPYSPPAGRRVNLWQVSLLVHLRSVSVTLLTVPAGLGEDTLHRTAVTRLLMNAEEPNTSRHPQNGWQDSSRTRRSFSGRMSAQMKRNMAANSGQRRGMPLRAGSDRSDVWRFISWTLIEPWGCENKLQFTEDLIEEGLLMSGDAAAATGRAGAEATGRWILWIQMNAREEKVWCDAGRISTVSGYRSIHAADLY